MSCVATWEDGPEYAPIERPSAFQDPDVPPLKIAAPYPQMAAWAPKSRPVFDSPEKPVAPLATLLPAREEPRDPQQPFAVVSSTMTSDSAWGAVHWAAPMSRPAGALGAGALAPLPGDRHPRPDQPLVVQSATSPTPGNFPAPGTPSWWGPGPPARQPQPTSTVTARAVFDAATPGLCICLLIGGLVYLLSPIVLWIGVSLLARVKVAKDEVRRAYKFGLVALAVIGFLGTFIVDTGLGDWWGFVASWGLVICWGLLVSTLILVYRRLKSNSAPPPTDRSRWR
jgi:hypothetical protein